jgi:hypothetical protein
LGFRRCALSGAPAVLAPRLNVCHYYSCQSPHLPKLRSFFTCDSMFQCLALFCLKNTLAYVSGYSRVVVSMLADAAPPAPLAVVLALLAPPLRYAHPLPLPLALSAPPVARLPPPPAQHDHCPVGCGLFQKINTRDGRCCFEKGCAGVCSCKRCRNDCSNCITRHRTTPSGGPPVLEVRSFRMNSLSLSLALSPPPALSLSCSLARALPLPPPQRIAGAWT